MLIAHAQSKAVREAYETDDFYDLRVPICRIGPIISPRPWAPSSHYQARTRREGARAHSTQRRGNLLNDDFIETSSPDYPGVGRFQQPDDEPRHHITPTTPAPPPSPSQKRGLRKTARKAEPPRLPQRPQQTDPRITNRRHPPPEKADRLTPEESRRRNRERSVANRLRLKTAGLCLDCRAASPTRQKRCQNCADNKQLEESSAAERKTSKRIEHRMVRGVGHETAPRFKRRHGDNRSHAR